MAPFLNGMPWYQIPLPADIVLINQSKNGLCYGWSVTEEAI